MRTQLLIFGLAVLSALSSLAQDLPPNATANHVLVRKQEHTLTLLDHGKVLKTYKVALGGEPVGAKQRQGDHKTPEGTYVLDRRNPHSQFYRSIHARIRTRGTRARAQKLHASPGGDIYVHGLPNGYRAIGKVHRLKDWTDGCIAVTDEEMDEIWRAVPDGTPIEIKP